MKKPDILLFCVDGGSPSYVLDGIKQGKLPGFERLMKKGVSFSDCMTVFPSISPTCWTSISTGAVPKVHGGLCQTMHPDGKDPWEFMTPYSSLNTRAERFWETAAKTGKKSLIINACASGPAKTDNVTQIMGGQSITPDKDPGETYMSGLTQQYFHINNNEIFVSGAKTPSGEWTLFEKAESSGTKVNENTYVFPVVRTDPRHVENEVEKITWTVIVEENGIKIGEDEQTAKNAKLIAEKEWTDVIERRLMTSDGEKVSFHFRARLDSFDKTAKSCVVYVTAAKNILKEVYPLEDARELQYINEVPSTNAHGVAIWEENCDVQKFIDCESFEFSWRRKIMRNAVEKHDYDIIFDGCGLIDTINHRFRRFFEKRTGTEKDYVRAIEAYEKGYKLVDDHINWLLDNIADENTVFAVVSDHGSVGWRETADICATLEKAGLITYTTDDPTQKTWRNDKVDWSKTKAYPVGSSYVNVNLKGRESCGSVDEKDYDKTVTEIIKALQMYTETSDGTVRGLAFAVPGDQAGFVGVGGPNCGDVVYGIIGSDLGGYYGQVHGNQIPSARTKTGDIRSICIMSGKAFKENETVTRPIDLTDIAPTFCYAADYPQPADATGGIVFAAYKNGGYRK